MPEHSEDPLEPRHNVQNELASAQTAAQAAAGSAVRHVKSVAVVESSAGGVVWEGKVEVFDVINPPPTRVYAWPAKQKGDAEYIAVLGVFPIDSALAAVRDWLANGARKNP